MEWFEQLKKIWTRLPAAHRVFMATVAVALIILVVAVVSWASREELSVLYAKLEPEDAGSIVDELESMGVEYKLGDGGRTIEVPRGDVYEVRLQLASEGLPNATGQGYEILDSNKMGWTDFVQKLQYRRALEGELARTIQTLDEVAQARIHLVIPEPSLFQEDERPTTASVVLKLRPGASVRDPQVQGIVHMVSAGVEGLTAENVTVLDTSGRLLSKPTDADGLLGVTGDQIYLTRTVEEDLVRKAQSALERVLGPNKAVVRISAELDFERVETTREIYDNETPAVRSEQRTEQSEGDGGSTEESITNYELSKTIQHAIDQPGAIRRLSASVFVDGTYQTGEDGVRAYLPRGDEEMNKLISLIKAAIGYNVQRGDELSVENIAFDDTQMQQTVKEMEKVHQLEMIQKIGTVAVSLLLAGGALFILWKLLGRVAAPAAGGRAASTTRLIDDEDDDEKPERNIERMRMERKLKDIAEQPPEDIARVIRAWMQEAS